MSDEIKYWMALNSVKGVGPKTIRKLISRFGSIDKIFSAPIIEIARMVKLNLTLAQEIADAKEKLDFFEKLILQLSKTGIQVLCPDNLDYPFLLKGIDNFPPILYKIGAGTLKYDPAIAIVGTRTPTFNGIYAAEKISQWLVNKGFTIVSGLAIGIDTAAHKGALKAGGKTIAVLGSGLKMIYPHKNIKLADDICKTGAIFSEREPNELVSSGGLIQRNRIISGICSGIILIEPGKSGALNAAYWASRQKRQIFVYNPKKTDLLPETLSQIAFSVNLKELDNITELVSIAKNESFQIQLL